MKEPDRYEANVQRVLNSLNREDRTSKRRRDDKETPVRSQEQSKGTFQTGGSSASGINEPDAQMDEGGDTGNKNTRETPEGGNTHKRKGQDDTEVGEKRLRPEEKSGKRKSGGGRI